MTCFAVAVIVTLAICGGAVHSSVIVPWTLGTAVLPPLSYTAQTLNLNGLQVGTVVAGQPARLVQVAVPATPTLLRTAPGLSLTQGSTVQVVGAPAALELTAEVPTDVEVLPVVPVLAPLLQAEGTYVAATRGAVHTAPLAGHAQSVSSANLEPAPGTV